MAISLKTFLKIIKKKNNKKNYKNMLYTLFFRRKKILGLLLSAISFIHFVSKYIYHCRERKFTNISLPVCNYYVFFNDNKD